MCGICGKVSFGRQDVERAALARMCAKMVSRGPDDEGIHVDGPAGLAQRRLSVIDLSAGATAPLPNEDRTVWVTLNGEIYNFADLRAGLIAQGHVFRTMTDTEVVVHLYEEHGIGCLAKLRGMFAVGIWDATRRILFAARDRLGKKPLFYAKTADGLVFASSAGALLADGSIAATPDYHAIDAYLTYQYVPSPETAFGGIRKLPAGHYLECRRDGDLQVRRYWQPPLLRPEVQSSAARDELIEEIRRRLTEAVRVRMVADVPIGAFLSGGVDSSAVVALMARLSPRPVKTFSIGFEDVDFDELPYARRLAERYATEHHEFVVRPDAAAILPLLVREYGEPFADSSALPTYYLSQMTRRHVTVALSGDGGDETFAGYENYRMVAAWGQADVVPGDMRRAVRAGVETLVDHLPPHPATARVAKAAAMWGSDAAERFRLQSSIFKPGEKRLAYTAGFQRLLASDDRRPPSPESVTYDERVEPLDWMMWHDLQYYLPDCLMVKVDVASMANSLEVRAPLLDHEFVEFAATIPAALKRDASGGKTILKAALAGIVPEETLRRPKKGFGVPLARWFTADLLELVRGTLLDETSRRRGLLEPGFLRRIVDDHREGRHDWSHRLWALVWLELWFREFID